MNERRNNLVNKDGWLWLAPQYFDQWRIFPRAFIIFYFWLCFEAAMWFMGLPSPSAAQSAFASAIIAAGAGWFGIYVNSGPGTRRTNTLTSESTTMTTTTSGSTTEDQSDNPNNPERTQG